MKTSTAKIISILLMLAIILASVLISPTVYASQLYVTDTYFDTQYTISQSGNAVTIQSPYSTSQLIIDNKVVQANCYGGNLALLCVSAPDNFGITYSAYFYNTSTGETCSFTTSHNAAIGHPSFTADKYRNIYLTDTYDKRVMYVYSERSSKSAVCSEPILQLMCIDGENILAFTQSGVFIYNSGTFSKVPDITPVPPCRYSANKIITDQNGTQYVYKSGALTSAKLPANNPETKPAENNSLKDLKTKAVIIENSCIYLKESITYITLCSYFDVDKDDFVIHKADGTTLLGGKLGTGMTALYNSKKYEVIVMGDLTGEGNINSRDLNALMKHLTGEVSLNNTSSKAADVNYDGVINTKDLLILAGLY